MAIVQDISFRSIPHQPALFLSYLDLTPAALRFYRYPPATESLESAARDMQAGQQFPRKAMASILRRQNGMVGTDSETAHRIDELEKPDSVAILTGQQIGMFTGPLYTIYKALSAVHISDELNKRGIRAVPVFWMDTEDHDLPEITRRTVLDSDSRIQVIDYRDSLFSEADTMRPVGSLRFPPGITQAVRDYAGSLPNSRWKPQMEAVLESSCKPGADLAHSFAQLMSQILRGSGLIFFNPNDAAAKRLTGFLFQKALRDADTIRGGLFKRNHELKTAGYQPQVRVAERSTVLFFLEDGRRYALEKRGSGFGLKNSGRVFSLNELLNRAAENPEKFSPNVLLRPLIQDHLFPTIAYVGGSSELAYFAQIEVLYTHFGRPMPVLWPRNSYTLLEPEIGEEMQRCNIDLMDCFLGERHIKEKSFHNSGVAKASASLEELKETMDRGLTGILPEVQSVDPPLAQALETARRKIFHNIRRMKLRLTRIEDGRNASVSARARAWLNHCYPNQNLQERELNILHFLARHGPPLLDTIHSATEIGHFAHRVIRLKDGA
jgi:bacillithiol biosynthesis cysteine-adding enzyme BshC